MKFYYTRDEIEILSLGEKEVGEYDLYEISKYFYKIKNNKGAIL